MKVVFVSNYYNHHQAPFSEAMARLLENDYFFIQTEEMDSERKSLGWGNETIPNYVYNSFESEEKYEFCLKLINEADVVIHGAAPYKMIKRRLKNGKLVFVYSERWYKQGIKIWKYPYNLLKHRYLYGRYCNLYMLCASAYTAYDCSITGVFKKKTYEWGYFPRLIEYNRIDEMLKNKASNSILWVGRLIDWKHPEVPLIVAKRLMEEGYSFNLNIIGTGILENQIKKRIIEYGLENCVTFLGPMKPEEVRDYMEKSEIFLFTSDFNEGWGAVLNESMNSACAVVASHAIGSVPYLLQDKENGLIYKNGNIDDCYIKVKYLLDNQTERIKYGKMAYETINNLWNADVATERFLHLAQTILDNNKHPNLYDCGPCSKAEIIKNSWYK